MKEFIEKIMQTLRSNGFPEKRVSLPTDKMYEAADNKGLSFNLVLEQMKADHQVEALIGAEKIIFSQVVVTSPEAPLDPQEMMRQAQEMMAKMDPEELRKLQEMFTSLSDEQKEEIMKKGKDFGIL